jgi:hypothetical protein
MLFRVEREPGQPVTVHLHTMVTFIDKYAKMMTEHFGDAQ